MKKITTGLLVNIYTKALFKSAINQLPALSKDLELLQQYQDNLKDWQKFVHNVKLNKQQLPAVNILIASLELLPITKTFLQGLASNYRLSLLAKIIMALQKKIAIYLQQEVVEITCARELNAAEIKMISEKINALSLANLGIQVQVDKKLLAGFTIKYQAKVLDYSLANKITRLKTTMLNAIGSI
jgi:ATP synthase F1 delta subunit